MGQRRYGHPSNRQAKSTAQQKGFSQFRVALWWDHDSPNGVDRIAIAPVFEPHVDANSAADRAENGVAPKVRTPTQGPDSGKPLQETHRQAAVELYSTVACPIADSTGGAASGCVAKSPLS